MKLSSREVATVLAALRHWQEETSDVGGMSALQLMPEHFIDEDPLDFEEISDLCEYINTED